MSNVIALRMLPGNPGVVMEVRMGDGETSMKIPLEWGEPFRLHLQYESGEEVDLTRITEGKP